MTSKLLSIARKVLLTALLAMMLGAITVLVVLPRATHGRALTVLTGSMTPSIPVGSIVLVQPVDTRTLHVGDVATYQGGTPSAPDFVTHRIVKIDTSTTPTTFTFKGDANRGPDIKPVPATAIRGKVWFRVPYLGSVRDAMHTRGGLAGVAMLLLAGYSLYQGSTALRDRRRKSGDMNTSTHDLDLSALNLDSATTQFSVLATVHRDAFDGLSPTDVSRALGATLLTEQEESFTLVLAQVDQARHALELLEAAHRSGFSNSVEDESEVAATAVGV